mmetsp:Transcript_1769/g.7294  ORF Transcript_1769/g.7294 Transcript_1769/m.7294 type:complete len:513 (-) Transcript_1769:27-1565(-)
MSHCAARRTSGKRTTTSTPPPMCPPKNVPSFAGRCLILYSASFGNASPGRARNTTKYNTGKTPHTKTHTRKKSPRTIPKSRASRKDVSRSSYPTKPTNLSAFATDASALSVFPGNFASNSSATLSAFLLTATRTRAHAGTTRILINPFVFVNESNAFRDDSEADAFAAPYAEPITTCRSPNSAFALWPWRFQYNSEKRLGSGSTGSPFSMRLCRSAASSASLRSRRRAEDLRNSRTSFSKFSFARPVLAANASYAPRADSKYGRTTLVTFATNASTRSRTPKPSRIARVNAVAARRTPFASANPCAARLCTHGGNHAFSHVSNVSDVAEVPPEEGKAFVSLSGSTAVSSGASFAPVASEFVVRAVASVSVSRSSRATRRSSRSISARARSSSSRSADAIAASSDTSTGSATASTPSSSGGGVADSTGGIASGGGSSLGESDSGSGAFAVSGVASTVVASIAGATVETSGLASPASHEPCVSHDASCAETRTATSASASTARSVARRAIPSRG